MTRKELRNRLETGTATEQDYELITSIIISEMTTDSLKKLNPNWLYHINNLTFKKISDEAFDTLYELSMQSTLEREDEFVFNKESKRNPHPNMNLGGDEFLPYYRQYMV